jgi:hypothetical protein
VIQWSLHTDSEHWQYFQSVFLSLAVGQIELTWVQNGPVGFKKNVAYMLHNNFVSRGLQRTNRKIGKAVTVHHRELLKKRQSLGTYCTQSVIEGLSRNISFHKGCAMAQVVTRQPVILNV